MIFIRDKFAFYAHYMYYYEYLQAYFLYPDNKLNLIY